MHRPIVFGRVMVQSALVQQAAFAIHAPAHSLKPLVHG